MPRARRDCVTAVARDRRIQRTLAIAAGIVLLAGVFLLERALRILVESHVIAILLLLLLGVSVVAPLASSGSSRRRG